MTKTDLTWTEFSKKRINFVIDSGHKFVFMKSNGEFSVISPKDSLDIAAYNSRTGRNTVLIRAFGGIEA